MKVPYALSWLGIRTRVLVRTLFLWVEGFSWAKARRAAEEKELLDAVAEKRQDPP